MWQRILSVLQSTSKIELAGYFDSYLSCWFHLVGMASLITEVILAHGLGQSDTQLHSKSPRGQIVTQWRGLKFFRVVFTDVWIQAAQQHLSLYALSNIYRLFKDQVWQDQFPWSVSELCLVNTRVVGTALLDLHRGGLECGVCVWGKNNAPRLRRAKTEGQSSLITTLKHNQHLFRPNTTLSLGINLLNCWIVTLSRGKVGQEPVCQGSSETPSKPYITANSVRRPDWAFTAETQNIFVWETHEQWVQRNLGCYLATLHIYSTPEQMGQEAQPQRREFTAFGHQYFPLTIMKHGAEMAKCKMPFVFAPRGNKTSLLKWK